jgi:predicted O-methyltransferase YrrM
MHYDKWSQVDEYFSDLFVKNDDVLSSILHNSANAGLPLHHVSPCQGRFLQLIAMIQGARRILEIGTLGAYSTVCLARALNDEGVVVTIEGSELHWCIAKENIKASGLQERIVLHYGEASMILQGFIDTGVAPFDMIFIDADKQNNPLYLKQVLNLSQRGTLIVGDNVVREGTVINSSSTDPNVQGIRDFCELLSNRKQFKTSAIQTVGLKGYDGFTLSIVQSVDSIGGEKTS